MTDDQSGSLSALAWLPSLGSIPKQSLAACLPVVHYQSIMSLLKSAAGSRAQGTSYGYGTWGKGSTPLSKSQLERNANLKKLAVKASLAGDYALYNQLVAEMNAQ
jgi:hypothetical protein